MSLRESGIDQYTNGLLLLNTPSYFSHSDQSKQKKGYWCISTTESKAITVERQPSGSPSSFHTSFTMYAFFSFLFIYLFIQPHIYMHARKRSRRLFSLSDVDGRVLWSAQSLHPYSYHIRAYNIPHHFSTRVVPGEGENLIGRKPVNLIVGWGGQFLFFVPPRQFSQDIGEWPQNQILIPGWTYFHCPGATLFLHRTKHHRLTASHLQCFSSTRSDRSGPLS